MGNLEEAVIGSLLIDNSQWSKVNKILRPEMMYDGLNRVIYTAIGREIGSGREVDTTILTEICTSDAYDRETVFKRLCDCTVSCESSTHAKQYATQARRVWAAWRHNQLMKDMPVATPQNIGQCAESLKAIADTLMPADEEESNGKSLAQVAKEHKGEYFCEKAAAPYNTGFPILDDCVKLEPGDVTIIGALPSVGKSAYVTQIAKHLSDTGNKVGFFSLEMSQKQCYERFVVALSGIGLKRLTRAVAFTNDEEERFAKANADLEKAENLILYEGSFSVKKIEEKVKENHFDVVIVDYLQLVTPSNRYGGNRVQEVGEISHGLKRIAMDYKCHVIALSQFNRSAAHADAGEPSSDQLRESGDIEQDASNIILLWNNSKDDNEHKTLKIDKCRQGERFVKITLRFNGDSMHFEEEGRVGEAKKADKKTRSDYKNKDTDKGEFMNVEEDNPFTQESFPKDFLWR